MQLSARMVVGLGRNRLGRRPPNAGYELRNVVEPALARALVLAAEAQRWDVVLGIAAELQARREDRPKVMAPCNAPEHLARDSEMTWRVRR